MKGVQPHPAARASSPEDPAFNSMQFNVIPMVLPLLFLILFFTHTLQLISNSEGPMYVFLRQMP